MELQKHFESFTRSLETTALPGYTEYSNVIPTKRPDLYPKAIDFLTRCYREIHGAIRSDNYDGYVRWLTHLQSALLAMFEKMVTEVYLDAKVYTPEMVEVFITEYGWRWFKYGSKHLEVDLRRKSGDIRFRFIPRYKVDDPRAVESPGVVTICADEAELLFSSRTDPSEVRIVTAYKSSHPDRRLIALPRDGSEAQYTSVFAPNVDNVVIDWTANLF